jgi:hypothetical protein
MIWPTVIFNQILEIYIVNIVKFTTIYHNRVFDVLNLTLRTNDWN